MYEVNDHPTIRNLLRTGYPDGREPQDFCCPICGVAAEQFYETKDGTIVGCECCLTCRYYYEYEAEDY